MVRRPQRPRPRDATVQTAVGILLVAGFLALGAVTIIRSTRRLAPALSSAAAVQPSTAGERFTDLFLAAWRKSEGPALVEAVFYHGQLVDALEQYNAKSLAQSELVDRLHAVSSERTVFPFLLMVTTDDLSGIDALDLESHVTLRDDLSAAYLSVFAAVAALYERERTGRGRNIPVPQVSASMAIQATEMIFRNGQPGPDRGGPELLGLSATYRLFKAADRWIFLAGKGVESWPVICRILGLDALAQQHTPEEAASAASTSEIGEALAQAFTTRPGAEWSERLIQAGVSCVPIFSIDDPGYTPDALLASPQIEANEFVARHLHPAFGNVRQPGQFVRFGGTPAVSSLTSPLLGQHNEEIARSLGYDDVRIATLREKGVLVART